MVSVAPRLVPLTITGAFIRGYCGCGVSRMSDFTPRDLMLGDVIALDPASRFAGVAHFAGGKLQSVGRLKCLPEPGDTDASRCLRAAQKVLTWVVEREIAPRYLVTEFPQVYGVGASKADPNDLTPMACMVGAVAGMLFSVAASLNVGFECTSYLPRVWKQGTRDKEEIRADVTTRLAPDELILMPASTTDEWDAVGIGLYALGRFAPVRSFPGAV